MKKYRVKEEYAESWFAYATQDDIEMIQAEGMDKFEIEDLADGWGVPFEDLMKQVEEI